MKGRAYSLGMKITAWFVCFLTLVVTVASACLIVYMLGAGFYTTSEDAVREEYIDNLMYSDCLSIGQYYIAGYEDIAELYKYRNLQFKITREDGSLITGNYDGEDYLYSYTLRFLPDGVFGEGKTGTSSNSELLNKGETFAVEAFVPAVLNEIDGYSAIFKWVGIGFRYRVVLCIVFLTSLFATALLAIYLLAVAGRKRGVEGIVLGPLEKIPLDLYAGVLLLFNMMGFGFFGYFSTVANIIFGSIFFLADYILLSGFCISIAAWLKAGGLLKNTLIWKAVSLAIKILRWGFRVISSFFKNLSLLWKTLIFIFALLFLGLVLLLVAAYSVGLAVLLAFGCWALFSIAALIITLNMQRIKKGGELLAAGDFNTKIDTTNMFWDFKQHAEALNRISDGMTVAVEERIKSERFRTELITNVSHDLKTPLTSIINYVDLLKKEMPENEKIRDYIEVLDRQAHRLRKLTEDLVEASKASTGNISLELTSCELGELLMQAAGEYSGRLSEAGLEIITSIPEEPVNILADGRHLWRIIDNLMNNICKYAQPSTRVYLNLEKKGKTAVITFKNVSKYALNISSDELMERFVRGDASRHTEGSGLGLSIARSLVELQKGEMSITIDGDLFKVCLLFGIE